MATRMFKRHRLHRKQPHCGRMAPSLPASTEIMPHLHKLEAFSPALDDPVQRETDGVPPQHAGVEHGPVHKSSVVMHLTKKSSCHVADSASSIRLLPAPVLPSFYQARRGEQLVQPSCPVTPAFPILPQK